MKKVPTLFERDWNGDRSRVVDKINPAAQWVIEEGLAARAYAAVDMIRKRRAPIVKATWTEMGGTAGQNAAQAIGTMGS